MKKVPFGDLSVQYQSIKPEIDAAIQSVIDRTAFIKGPDVSKFEDDFRDVMGSTYCVSCANGTDAIYITLKALGIGPGDEVITVANSWISTSETISQTGATPVFVDCDPQFNTIDPSLIKAKITPKTKAIIPVHLYGQAADLDPILHLCDTHNLHCIEDCAQAHLATYKTKTVGTLGIAGTFSFFPGKNLGAYGDAGAIITSDKTLAENARRFANHGALVKHHHDIEGINSRIDGLQAAILSVKLPHLKNWTAQRQKNAARYTQNLKNIPQVRTPDIRQDSTHVFHLYVIQAENRDDLDTHLKNHGIQTGRHYPTPLPLLKAYAYLNMSESDIPIAAHNQHTILSLPMYPELSNENIDYVCETIQKFYA